MPGKYKRSKKSVMRDTRKHIVATKAADSQLQRELPPASPTGPIEEQVTQSPSIPSQPTTQVTRPPAVPTQPTTEEVTQSPAGPSQPTVS